MLNSEKCLWQEVGDIKLWEMIGENGWLEKLVFDAECPFRD